MKKCTFLLLFLATINANAYFGNVLYMDGQGDFVQLFEPILTDSPFTIDAWVYSFDAGGY